MMKTRLAVALATLLLAGCGTHVLRPSASTKFHSVPRGMSRAAIVDVPGVPVGVSQAVSGKYQKYKIKGTGLIKALDEARLDVAAKLSAKIGPITLTKEVTFAIARRDDAAWPYQFTVKNLTDKETFENKAQVVSAENGSTTFKMDDGTTSLIAADGLGSVRVVNGDFDLMFGKAARMIGPAITNPPGATDWFAN
jgi:hypothetical protein